MATAGSEGPDFWTAVMAIATGLGGGLLALWRAAVLIGGLNTRVTSLEDDVEKIGSKTDTRHEDNQKWMREVSSKMVTRDDLRSLESLIRSRFHRDS